MSTFLYHLTDSQTGGPYKMLGGVDMNIVLLCVSSASQGCLADISPSCRKTKPLQNLSSQIRYILCVKYFSTTAWVACSPTVPVDSTRQETNGGSGNVWVQQVPLLNWYLPASLQNVMVKKHALELTTSFIIPLVSCEYLLAHRFVAVTELVIHLLLYIHRRGIWLVWCHWREMSLHGG